MSVSLPLSSAPSAAADGLDGAEDEEDLGVSAGCAAEGAGAGAGFPDAGVNCDSRLANRAGIQASAALIALGAARVAAPT